MKTTSHADQTDDPNDTSDVLNQVTQEYNGLGQLTKQRQDVDSVVAAMGGVATVDVIYSYDTTSSSNIFTKGHRAKSMTYPSGRIMHKVYDGHSGIDDAVSRLSKLSEDSGGSPGTAIVTYDLMGDGRMVRKNYPTPEVRLDLWGGTSDTYANIDRFGRTTDHRWHDHGASADRDRFKHGYDRNSNRMYRDHSNTTTRDALYSYDNLNRLTDFDKGDLNGGNTAISTLAFAQQWQLSAVGNWSEFKEDANGDTDFTDAGDLDQDRSHNKVNEITDITEAGGQSAWATPAQDAAGNVTGYHKPSSPTSSFTAKYDAWNRLVEVKEGTTLLGSYLHDGLGRRITRKTYVSGVLDKTRRYYYSSAYQIIEERVDERTNDIEKQYVWGIQYVDELVQRDRDSADDGTLEEKHFALQDANYNLTCIVDANGDAQERYSYTPYGVRTIHDGSFGSRASSSYDWNVGHQGLHHDEESALVYNRARMLSPQLGRFVQRDPLGYVDGMNLYESNKSRPQLDVDPLGLSKFIIPTPSIPPPPPGCAYNASGMLVCLPKPPPSAPPASSKRTRVYIECRSTGEDVNAGSGGKTVLSVTGGKAMHCSIVVCCGNDNDHDTKCVRYEMGEANITQLGQSSIDPDDYITVGGHPVLPLPGTRIYRWERWGVRRIPSSSIVDGNCCGIYDCLKDEFGPTNRAAPPYSPTGPNSNTFVKSLLSRCGLEFMPEPGQPRPGGAVGWGDPSY